MQFYTHTKKECKIENKRVKSDLNEDRVEKEMLEKAEEWIRQISFLEFFRRRKTG